MRTPTSKLKTGPYKNDVFAPCPVCGAPRYMRVTDLAVYKGVPPKCKSCTMKERNAKESSKV